MNKIYPEDIIQDTPVVEKTPEAVGTWYVTETKEGFFSSVELPWLMAQGWEVINKERRLESTSESTYTTITNYAYYYYMRRRAIKPETVLDDLVTSYTEAYNAGRLLNDQRYDDAISLYIACLDETEDTFNSLEAEDEAFEPIIQAILSRMELAVEIYQDAIDRKLNSFGVSQRAKINARFDSELSKADQALINRGMYNSTVSPTISVGIERERTLALNDLEEKILLQQVSLYDKIHDSEMNLLSKILDAKERLKDNLRKGVEMQVNVRNQVLEALVGIIERREDGYPGLEAIGELAASLGAGSTGVYTP